MNLFHVQDQIKALLLQIEETGEITDEIRQELNDLEESVENKLISLGAHIKNLRAERDAVKQARKDMQDREQQLERRIESLENYTLSNMKASGHPRITTSHFVMQVKQCPESVFIEDESLITDDFKEEKVLKTICKDRIKFFLKMKKEVPGAKLIRNIRLHIR